MTTMTRDQVHEKVREARSEGRHADLTGTDLTNADLRGANLTNADLTWSDLAYAILREANLTEADLTGANLTGADLRGATLTDTWLEGAHLTTNQLLDTRGLQPGRHGLPRAIWSELLPTNPGQRQLVKHLLNDGWNGTLREAIETAEGLTGR